RALRRARVQERNPRWLRYAGVPGPAPARVAQLEPLSLSALQPSARRTPGHAAAEDRAPARAACAAAGAAARRAREARPPPGRSQRWARRGRPPRPRRARERAVFSLPC